MYAGINGAKEDGSEFEIFTWIFTYFDNNSVNGSEVQMRLPLGLQLKKPTNIFYTLTVFIRR